MKLKRTFQIGVGLMLLLFLVGCTGSTPVLTLTINEDVCTLDGPTTIPYGELTIKLITKEEKPESGYSLVTLNEGKTLADLQSGPSTDTSQPDCVVLIDGVHEFGGGNHTYTYELADPIALHTTAYHGEPLYIVCFRADPGTGFRAKIGAFGPIEVKK